MHNVSKKIFKGRNISLEQEFVFKYDTKSEHLLSKIDHCQKLELKNFKFFKLVSFVDALGEASP